MTELGGPRGHERVLVHAEQRLAAGLQDPRRPGRVTLQTRDLGGVAVPGRCEDEGEPQIGPDLARLADVLLGGPEVRLHRFEHGQGREDAGPRRAVFGDLEQRAQPTDRLRRGRRTVERRRGEGDRRRRRRPTGAAVVEHRALGRVGPGSGMELHRVRGSDVHPRTTEHAVVARALQHAEKPCRQSEERLEIPAVACVEAHLRRLDLGPRLVGRAPRCSGRRMRLVQRLQDAFRRRQCGPAPARARPARRRAARWSAGARRRGRAAPRQPRSPAASTRRAPRPRAVRRRRRPAPRARASFPPTSDP